MTFDVLPSERYVEYEQTFQDVFKNPDAKRIEIHKKLNGYGQLKPVALVAYTDDLEIASLLAIYPQYYSLDGDKFLGGQIGDALTVPQFRGRGIFKQLVRFATKIAQGLKFDFLLTFPNTNNKGSYLSFIGNDWKEACRLTIIEKMNPVKLTPRLIRKLGKKAYTKFEYNYIRKLKTEDFSRIQGKQSNYSGVYDSDYFHSKKYNSKYLIKLNSGYAYVSLTEFQMTLGLYKLNKNQEAEQLIKELAEICENIGKDFLVGIYSPGKKNDFNKLAGKKHQPLVALIYSLTPEQSFQNLQFTAADIDTF